jgi:signal transduction histidine kinase
VAKWYVEGFSERSGIPVNLVVPPELKRLSAGLALTLFRILQESLTNIHRHSHSSSVNVQLELAADRIILQVRDDGHGLSPKLLERFKAKDDTGVGIGLRSMRERVSEIGGTLEIESDKNGTVIRVFAPLSDAPKKSAATGNDPGYS